MMVRKKAPVALVVGAGGSYLPTGNGKPPKHLFNTKSTKNHKGGTKAAGRSIVSVYRTVIQSGHNIGNHRRLPIMGLDALSNRLIGLAIDAHRAIVPAHEAQILTYPRMSGMRLGWLMNFHAVKLKDGLKRFVVRNVLCAFFVVLVSTPRPRVVMQTGLVLKKFGLPPACTRQPGHIIPTTRRRCTSQEEYP